MATGRQVRGGSPLPLKAGAGQEPLTEPPAAANPHWLAPWLTHPPLTVKGSEASWPPFGPLRSANILRPDPLTVSLGGWAWAPVRAADEPPPRPTGASKPSASSPEFFEESAVITMNSTNSKPRELRAMMALVVLAAELPMPMCIRFQGEGIGEPGTSIMDLHFDRVRDGQAWSRHLGGRADTYRNTDGNTYLRAGSIKWHGWSVALFASEKTLPDSALDQDTNTRLVAIAGGAQ